MTTKFASRRQFLKIGAGSAGMAVSSAITGRILGANDRIRVGIVGCGSRGNYLLSELLKHSQRVEVSALCDVWRVNLEKTRKRLEKESQTRVRTSSRYLELLEDQGIDAVVIATPDFAHTPVLIDALYAGKDAFVEKPMATEVEDANEALDLAREKNAVVQVGTQRRSDQIYLKAAGAIQSGILGTVSEVEAGWHDNKPRWARRYDDVRAEDVNWQQFAKHGVTKTFSAERFRRWHLFKEYTVGTPGLLGSHLIDVATWFMDDPLPKSAVAHGGVYVWNDGREHADTLDCIIEYPKGFIVNYSTRLGNRFPGQSSGGDPIPTTFYGTKATFDTKSWMIRPEGAGKDAIGEAIQITVEDEGGDHVGNWIDCMVSRRTTNAPIEAGYAHSIASIMCFKAWESGVRQVYDPEDRKVRAG